MKKIVLALALSFAVPAFAADAPKTEKKVQKKVENKAKKEAKKK